MNNFNVDEMSEGLVSVFEHVADELGIDPSVFSEEQILEILSVGALSLEKEAGVEDGESDEEEDESENTDEELVFDEDSFNAAAEQYAIHLLEQAGVEKSASHDEEDLEEVAAEYARDLVIAAYDWSDEDMEKIASIFSKEGAREKLNKAKAFAKGYGDSVKSDYKTAKNSLRTLASKGGNAVSKASAKASGSAALKSLGKRVGMPLGGAALALYAGGKMVGKNKQASAEELDDLLTQRAAEMIAEVGYDPAEVIHNATTRAIEASVATQGAAIALATRMQAILGNQ